ncbi:(Fe-S)-binding protein [Mammaliicoccus stepanovicii]|uniref:Glycolate oxidase iron-sulfur subunit n=1 Tax=Mammaliicoccus stepanovicii TaxID=643214 RepID=A0A239YN33_9STAP|nr:(Fe-S)-binding protein [Mammaliicoccus stepanovicii]PNZ75569.1 Fe-S oxidoreductase [Mammaliicoccus stepanovicii]GGI41125.1 lactate utilization protein A [Mammaliicoccus stepanovicii]SNV59806.1 glycolate oxidase iron-sulfur subunit [Mammaliicoccus stepanovicii]
MKVSLFSTCLVEGLNTRVGIATVELLEKLGCEVDYPASQVCCGQPAFNSGYVEEAKQAAKLMIDTFEDSEYVVGPSGSCVTMFKHYPSLFENDSMWYKKALNLSEKSYELTQFIVDVLNVTKVGAHLKGKATVHPSCHMTRLLGVVNQPKALLENVEGLELVELPHYYNCCGFGGTFAVKMGDVSTEMVDEKVDSIAQSGADYLIGSDASCLMNIEGRIKRRGLNVKVLHIAEVLNNQVEKAVQ